MSETAGNVMIALIAGLPGIIAAVAAYMAKREAQTAKDKVGHVSELINSRMNQLLKTARAKSKAQGEAGIEAVRADLATALKEIEALKRTIAGK